MKMKSKMFIAAFAGLPKLLSTLDDRIHGILAPFERKPALCYVSCVKCSSKLGGRFRRVAGNRLDRMLNEYK